MILLVLIRSPMYFCRNLLLLSSLSCSSLTASMRLNIISNDSCRAFACLRSSSRASRPSASRSSLVLRGLMARTSPGSILTSVGSTASTDSRGTIMVPLLFRLGSRGRTGTGATMPGVLDWSTEDAEDESERAISGIRGGKRSCS